MAGALRHLQSMSYLYIVQLIFTGLFLVGKLYQQQNIKHGPFT